MIKRLAYIFLLLPAVLFAQLPEVEPHTEFKSIPLGHYNRLVESIVAREVFSLPELPGRPVIKGQVWKDWGANTISMTGDLSEMTLRFVDVRQVPKKKGESRAPSFDLSIVFEDKRFIEDRMALFTTGKHIMSMGDESFTVVLRHSRASDPRQTNGIRIGALPDRENRIFYNGLDETGLVIFAPKTPRTGFGGRGMLICPRNYDVYRSQRGLTKLEISDYELQSVSFKANGFAKGRVGSGMGPGFAKATIQTSDNITPTRFPVDLSTSNYPFVSVVYRPGRDIDAVPVAGQETVTAGLRIAMIHHNSFSHKTESIATVRLGLRVMDLKKPLRLKHKDRPFTVETGECVSILKEIELDQIHTKEDLPKRSLEKESESEESAEELPGENLFDENDGLDTGRKDDVSPLELLLE